MTPTDSSPTDSSPAAAAREAREAFATGRTTAPAWRREQLTALDRLLAENGPAIETALKSDLGKHPLETHTIEIGSVRSEIALTLANLENWLAPQEVPAPGYLHPATASTVLQPLGTVLIIAPWNYPVHLLLMPLVGAIAAGNAVVVKPSELAPQTSRLMAKLFPAYLDSRAIRLVEGAVEETTELLTAAWDHIFYTGNGTVAKIVMAAAAKHLTPVTLELGGKSPVWIDESADIDEAAAWLAWGKLLNAGQTCIAPDYVLATPAAVEPLVEALERSIAAMYGADPRASADYGRIVNARHVDRLARLCGSGTPVIGGQVDRDERYVAPTVLRDVSLDDPVMAEEIFGPVLPIITVSDADEAIALINSRDKPLALYCFTGRDTTRTAFLERTASGGLTVNATMVHAGVEGLPFGGVGASGMGAYHGERTLRVFSHERAVLHKLDGPGLARFGWAPYTAEKEQALRAPATGAN
ncbi:aldehyde dehydrogenase family protein [Streptomyces sp. NPDC051286]|uniref:aldehyde dehydrogenase family protein n=1 Tax=Streptomyces sp. NPDC051286 TaxID=3365647 RepID=UPI0037BA299E